MGILRRKASATVPQEGQTDADVLRARKAVWESHALVREIYRRYFEALCSELAPGDCTIELGGGSGHFKSHRSRTLVSDIVATPFVDFVADAMKLPLPDGSVDNLVLLDVLHHLPHPARLFTEASRVLRVGGRLVMLEPFISPFSRFVFWLAHPEPVDRSIPVLRDDDRPVFDVTGPFASNQAIPTRLFFDELPEFHARFPQLRLRLRRLDSLIVYPLSGGFSGPCLVPEFAQPLAWGLERLLSPLKRWLAFRVLITVERI